MTALDRGVTNKSQTSSNKQSDFDREMLEKACKISAAAVAKL